VAGLAQATLITEATEKSGSLHTANFALEQGRDVLAVPGNITSYLSTGTNNLIKSGATPVTTTKDIFAALNGVTLRLPTMATALIFRAVRRTAKQLPPIKKSRLFSSY